MKPETTNAMMLFMNLCILVGLIVGIFWWVNTISDVNINIKQQKVEPKPQPVYGEVHDFILVAQRFANYHTYNVTEYNCKNYTADLKAIADQLGFNTTIIEGFPTENMTAEPGHRWLRLHVDFEPQSGTFKDYSKVYPYYNYEVK